jgi:hypothetical protein
MSLPPELPSNIWGSQGESEVSQLLRRRKGVGEAPRLITPLLIAQELTYLFCIYFWLHVTENPINFDLIKRKMIISHNENAERVLI